MSKQAKTKQAKHRFAFHNWHEHPLVLPVALVLGLFFVGILLFVSTGATTMGATDTRVVSLSVDGETQIVPTRAETVEELLSRLDIELKETDVIEPALETEIHRSDFEVNIYTARAVLIEDEGEQVIIETAEPAPHDVVKAAGIDVYPEDIIKKDTDEPIGVHDVLQMGLISERIVIQRSTPVVLNFYGESYELRTHAETVGELLESKELELRDEDDTLEPSIDTPITHNLQIFLARVGIEIEVIEEEIPAPVETVEDNNLVMGQSEVREEGTPGLKAITYEIEMHNGVEHQRTVLQEVVVQEPAARVVAEGTRLPEVSNPSANVQTGQELASARGWGGDEFGCLYQLWQRESGWSHTAHNRSSGAYGIPQALPGSKMATVAGDWQTNPATQITWGLNYIQGRYGTPCGAYSFFLVNNWY